MRNAGSERLVGTLGDSRVFREISERAMYPWPIDNFHYVMDQALDIAMDYLERTGQAVKFMEAQRVAATAIVTAWRMGVRHRLRLADIAIKAVERKTEPFLENRERG
jgi:hypothetical protein